jgi:hypothetical protein
MDDLDLEAAANGTQSAPFGGTRPFFCKESDSKGVPDSIVQGCDCKGFLSNFLQWHDSKAISFGGQTMQL